MFPMMAPLAGGGLLCSVTPRLARGTLTGALHRTLGQTCQWLLATGEVMTLYLLFTFGS